MGSVRGKKEGMVCVRIVAEVCADIEVSACSLVGSVSGKEDCMVHEGMVHESMVHEHGEASK